jgi:hypothetical protein
MTTALFNFSMSGTYAGFKGSGAVFQNTLDIYDIYNETVGSVPNYTLAMLNHISTDSWFYNVPILTQGNLGLAQGS